MVKNNECLQLITGNIVGCRHIPMFYDGPDLECPFSRCEAEIVLNNPESLEKVLGNSAQFGKDDRTVQKLVFHYVCPGVGRNLNMPLSEVIANSRQRRESEDRRYLEARRRL